MAISITWQEHAHQDGDYGRIHGTVVVTSGTTSQAGIAVPQCLEVIKPLVEGGLSSSVNVADGSKIDIANPQGYSGSFGIVAWIRGL